MVGVLNCDVCGGDMQGDGVTSKGGGHVVGGCDIAGEGKMTIMGLIVHPASKHNLFPCMSYILYLITQYDLFIHYTL